MKVTVFMIIVGIIFLCIFVGLLTLIVRALLKFGKLYRNVREICRRLPKADEAKGNPQQRD